MKDSNGNVVFLAKDGNVTCNSGTFNNVTVNGTINAQQGSITGDIAVSGKLTIGTTNKLVIDGKNSTIEGYEGSSQSMTIGYANGNNNTMSGIYLKRTSDGYTSWFQRHSWGIWGLDRGDLTTITASCNVTPLIEMFDKPGNHVTFGITSSGKFLLRVNSINMLPTRSQASIGQLFIGTDEILRIKLKS